MATVHIDDHGVNLGPPHLSVHLPRDASMGNSWVALTLF
jgi:hypothetical protein